MIAKVVIFFVLSYVNLNEGTGIASNRYPAGLDASLCPNYPYCDNAVLGNYAHGSSLSNQGLAAPGYPAYLNPHSCPNYPYCSYHIPQEALHYRRSPYSSAIQSSYVSGHGAQARYPAGVNPHTCPNYPYCH